ncbi:FAD dependent oxidoreductase [Xylariomycetidae sp. FL2044]|nr:FAD dependent oxidoreductase [Xylariomycetidae sp. FL2044]
MTAQPRHLSGLPVQQPTKSYWHKEPSEKLLGHRTTQQLPHSADVVIVGSGITGSFAAHFLKEKRPELNVVMLEAREACWGATGRNGGHCQPAMYGSAPHIASFELRNFSYLKTLVENYSIPCDWHSTTGVHAFYSPILFSVARDIVKRLQDRCPDIAANVAVLTKSGDEGGTPPSWLPDEERNKFTLDSLRIGDAKGAIVQRYAASLWPYKLVAFMLERLLAANLEAKGSFNLQTNTPATRLSRLSRVPSDSAEPSSRSTWEVQTPRGTIKAPQVLLATNGYTSYLLPSFADLVVPTRGQVSSLLPPEMPADPSTSPHLDIGHTYSILGTREAIFNRDDYLIQRPPPPTAASELVFGGGRQYARDRGVGVWDDGEIDEPVARYLREELGDAVDLSLRDHHHHHRHHHHGDDGKPPSSSSSQTEKKKETEKKEKQDLEPTYEWTGIMGFSRDAHPWVGRVPEILRRGNPTEDDEFCRSYNKNRHENDKDDTGGLWLCAGYTGHGMPNAALCARAVVDMMLSEWNGTETENEIDLPPEFKLTETRAQNARGGDEVEEIDARGSVFMQLGGYPHF